MMKTLEGKVALVTGAGRGIGAAIPERLALEGAPIAINYSTSKQDASAVAKRSRAGGGTATTIKADMANPVQAKSLVEAAVKQLGRFDILVNNAGEFTPCPLGAVNDADVRAQFALNVDGPIFATRAHSRLGDRARPQGYYRKPSLRAR